MTGLIPEEAKSAALARFNDSGEHHLNCAQTVVYFALLTMGEDFNLSAEDLDLVKSANYFGGGIAGRGEACGALTGAALALGLRDLFLSSQASSNHSELRAETAEQLRVLIRDFTDQFGSRRCADLTGFDLSTPEGHDAFMKSEAHRRCDDYVGWACDRLAPLLARPTRP